MSSTPGTPAGAERETSGTATPTPTGGRRLSAGIPLLTSTVAVVSLPVMVGGLLAAGVTGRWLPARGQAAPAGS
ncbi:hypothetical protein MUU72_19690 [Streptomyces sp. RS10V-4]|nr:hypothetical protein [Streptomyces rhizoryzae]